MDESLNRTLVAIATEFPGEIKTDGRNLVAAQLKTFLDFLKYIKPGEYDSIDLPSVHGDQGVCIPTDDNFSVLCTPVFTLQSEAYRQLDSGVIVPKQMAEECGIPHIDVAKSNYDNCAGLDNIRLLADRYKSRMRDTAGKSNARG